MAGAFVWFLGPMIRPHRRVALRAPRAVLSGFSSHPAPCPIPSKPTAAKNPNGAPQMNTTGYLIIKSDQLNSEEERLVARNSDMLFALMRQFVKAGLSHDVITSATVTAVGRFIARTAEHPTVLAKRLGTGLEEVVLSELEEMGHSSGAHPPPVGKG